MCIYSCIHALNISLHRAVYFQSSICKIYFKTQFVKTMMFINFFDRQWRGWFLYSFLYPPRENELQVELKQKGKNRTA